MDFKLVCTFIFLFFLSWGTPLGFSQETEQMDLEKSLDTLEQGLAGILQQVQQQGVAVASAAASQGGASADAMPCMQKLMPCQLFMHSTSPPAICCAPLKDVVTQESRCLCKVFDNPELLKSINLTMEGALALAKACGIDVDVSVCKNATSPGASPPSLPSTSSTSTLSFNQFSFVSIFSHSHLDCCNC
ncbi:non-specific lipid-transfer protein C6-like [Durio zibethinus]|uniref:Non-specific lipid-transfer protein C6-like n=1 Tax=Durio zibethinus TaxID=66656 RepID=A0A6P5ZRS1_DURZI|nr:non-specific lipid-transfer protein C6-like [Durio zibethinus]